MRSRRRLLLSFIAAACVAIVAGPAVAAPDGLGINTFSDDLSTIDLATGSATVIGPTGFDDAGGLAFRADGTLFAIDELTDTLFTVDRTSGAATPVGALGVDVESAGITFGLDGRLWMADFETRTLHEVDPATGLATAIGPFGQTGGFNNAVVGLAANCDGTIYGIGVAGELGGQLFVIDTATGTATAVGPTVNTSGVGQGLARDAAGVLWATAFGGGTFTVDPATGLATPVAAVAPFGFEDLAITPLVCPVTVISAAPTFTG